MTRMRCKCAGLNHELVHYSELNADEKYLKNLLPVNDDRVVTTAWDSSHILCKHLQSPGLTRRLVTIAAKHFINEEQAMDVDISCPTSIAEKVILQLLPQPLACCASDGGGVGRHAPENACAWFEDHTSMINSGGERPLVREIEVCVEDRLPCKPLVQSKTTSVELSSPVDKADDDFTKLKMQDFEGAAPISCPLIRNEEAKLRMLDDARAQPNSEADCQLIVKPFETHSSSDCEKHSSDIPELQNAEPHAIPVVKNPKADDHDLACQLDLRPATCMFDLGIHLGIERQSPQQKGPVPVSNNLLEDSSLDSNIRAWKHLRVQNTSEKPEIIKDERFEQIPSPKLKSYNPDMKTTTKSVVLVDSTSPDDSSPRDLMAPDSGANNGVKHRERRLPVGAGGGSNRGSPCTAAEDENSNHSTLSDEKTTCSTAPQSPSFKFDSTRSVSDLSLMNERNAYKEDTSHKQTEALKNASEDVLRVQDKTEAIHQQRGSISVSAASFEDIPWAVKAPPHMTSTIPSRHLTTQETSVKSCLGSGEMMMMMTKKQQPLVIVAANVQPDGPVLLQRRSSYQRVLALETEQLQVVERERHLPVDLILSPSTCLIVYTAETTKLNWAKISSAGSKEWSAFIVDIIINCQLKAMSFSFETCFMIFEGGPAYTSFILQATPELTVAAAAFGMQVQCFVSGNPQSTEDLALLCIERIRRKTTRPYPYLMSECVTDDELFLQQFPSLNPLAAHAILCLDVPLSTFVLWSHDVMADALQGFGVPLKSLRLFKLQCEHGSKPGLGPTYPDSFPFLASDASPECSDFEQDFKAGLAPLDRIFELDPLGPALRMDPNSLKTSHQKDASIPTGILISTCSLKVSNRYPLNQGRNYAISRRSLGTFRAV